MNTVSTPTKFYSAQIEQWTARYREAVARGDDDAAKSAAQEMRNYKQMLKILGDGNADLSD